MTLKACRSPYIINCYDACIERQHVKVALEFMDFGSLRDILNVQKKINENMIAYITSQVPTTSTLILHSTRSSKAYTTSTRP